MPKKTHVSIYVRSYVSSVCIFLVARAFEARGPVNAANEILLIDVVVKMPGSLSFWTVDQRFPDGGTWGYSQMA